MNIRLTNEERDGRTIGADKLALAVALLNAKGAVVIENVFPHERLSELRAAVVAMQPHEPTETGGRKRIGLPIDSEFTAPDIVEHPTLLSFADEVVGDDCILRTLTAVVVEAGAAASDTIHMPQPLFPESRHVRFPAHNLLIDVALDDLTADNGALDVWPGSHMLPDHMVVLHDPSFLRELAGMTPQETLPAPKGAVVIRDSRLWHRERPNATSNASVKLSLSYRRWWDIRDDRLPIPLSFFERSSTRLKRLLRFEDISEQYDGVVQA